jgi:penicillin-binding protein 1A
MPTESAAPRQRKKPRRRFGLLRMIGRIIAIFIMIGIITGCIVACVLTVYVLNTLDSSDKIVLDAAAMSYTTIIYAQDPETGEEIELQRVQNSENRIWVDYDQIPQSMKDAAVATEDMRFWSHSGIDLRRTIGATLNYLNPVATDYYGGSTITQQVVKNVTDDNDFRVDRKIREIFRAINLEKNYSKEQILETYLNTIALGNGTNGVQSAANVYFGKDVSELTAAECASIIAITQNPSKWNPFQHPENNRKRQLYVLGNMHEQTRPDGTPMLTDAQYDRAVAQEMTFETETYTESIGDVQNGFIYTV